VTDVNWQVRVKQNRLDRSRVRVLRAEAEQVEAQSRIGHRRTGFSLDAKHGPTLNPDQSAPSDRGMGIENGLTGDREQRARDRLDPLRFATAKP
jgi:hypothetical protein